MQSGVDKARASQDQERANEEWIKLPVEGARPGGRAAVWDEADHWLSKTLEVPPREENPVRLERFRGK
jgi:hypothetical protein